MDSEVGEMALKVYGTWTTATTAKVLTMMYELGLDFEIVDVDLLKGDHKKPEYKALQPFGMVPLLQDGPFLLFETRAIIRYLANKFEGKGTSLYGSTLKERALVEQWLEVEGQNYQPYVGSVVYQSAIAPLYGKVGDEAIIEANLKKLEATLDVYEAHLAKSKYLAGEFFSLADLSHLPFTHYLVGWCQKGAILDARPHVKKWWDDISSRDSWKKWQEMSNKSKASK